MRRSARVLRHRSQGFTLIEVLVAVAVLALAMGAVLVSSSRYADNAIYLRDKTFASWVGHNLLNEWQIQQEWPKVGKKEGKTEMAGRDWYWNAKISKTPDPQVRRVDLNIAMEKGDKAPSILTLSAFLVPPP